MNCVGFPVGRCVTNRRMSPRGPGGPASPMEVLGAGVLWRPLLGLRVTVFGCVQAWLRPNPPYVGSPVMPGSILKTSF